MADDRELAACWTCRENNWCEITHSSQAHSGGLFRCVNCKAVYPDFALTRPPADPDNEGLAGVIEPVRHWYESDEHEPRSDLDIVRDIVADLQHDRAEVLRLTRENRAALNPPKHQYWGAGEPDCPRDIKAGTGELHTLRCKVCGQDNPRDDRCLAALATAPRATEADEGPEEPTPFERGSFVGDIYFGDPVKRNLGTHRWDGAAWIRLPSEIEAVLQLLAAARKDRDNLKQYITDLLVNVLRGTDIREYVARSANDVIGGQPSHEAATEYLNRSLRSGEPGRATEADTARAEERDACAKVADEVWDEAAIQIARCVGSSLKWREQAAIADRIRTSIRKRTTLSDGASNVDRG